MYTRTLDNNKQILAQNVGTEYEPRVLNQDDESSCKIS